MGCKLTCKGAQTAVTPRLLVPYILAAKVNVRTGDECQIDAHEKVTGRQMAEVERVLHIAARLVEITAQQHQQITHHSYGGHDPNAAGKNKRQAERERERQDKQGKLHDSRLATCNVEVMKSKRQKKRKKIYLEKPKVVYTSLFIFLFFNCHFKSRLSSHNELSANSSQAVALIYFLSEFRWKIL